MREKCVKHIKLIYGVLDPGSVLKPGTTPSTRLDQKVSSLPYKRGR